MDFEYVQMSSNEEAEKHFKERGHWIVANVRQNLGWPEKKVIVYFRGIPLLFIPEEIDKYPALAVLCKDGVTENMAREAINHFLSSLSWSEKSPIKIEAWGGGGHPYVYGKSAGARTVSSNFRITYLPDTVNKEARLALAFYREAMTLEHPAYGFLSFYKIINLKYKTTKSQKKWIQDKLNFVDYWEGKKRLEELKKDLNADDKIAEYLVYSCRCAIAHADINSVTVNPEDYTDMARLRSDVPLVRGLVELLIEQEFGILRPSTVHKTHPYELFGFKAILGEAIIKEIINGNPVKDAPFPSEISVRLWGGETFSLFEGMEIAQVGVKDGGLILDTITSNNLIGVVLRLDFKKDRIIFDPQASVRISKDDGSVVWMESYLQMRKFLRKYWCNGILEIWDSKNEKCLGFSDAFIPVNIDLSATIRNFDRVIRRCEDELARRKENKPS